jgi:hypothetical protein
MPYPTCNMTDDGAALRMPDRFETEVDKDGSRH